MALLCGASPVGRLLEDFLVYRRIEFDRVVFGAARILAILFVTAQHGNRYSVNGLPVFHLSLAFDRTLLAECLVGLAQYVAGLGIDVPTNGGARRIPVDDAGFQIADPLPSLRLEDKTRIIPMGCDKDGIALDLLQRFRLSLSRHGFGAHAGTDEC